MSENDKRTRKSSIGQWKLHEGKAVFEETTITETFDLILKVWSITDRETKMYSPSDRGLVKSISFPILLMKLKPSDEDFEGVVKLFYVQTMTIEVRNDRTYVYLSREGLGKVYIHDLWYTQCFEAPLNSTPDIVVSKSKPIRVKDSELETVLKEIGPHYVFEKTVEEGNETTYGKVLRPS